MFTEYDFGDEFVNVHPESDMPGVSSWMEPSANGEDVEVTRRKAAANADGLRRAIERARWSYLATPGAGVSRSRRGGYVYFPPGRYHIGRPSARRSVDLPGDVRSDVVVPPEVTLWFAPGAVLVPRHDAPLGLERLPPGEKERVYIEIQGDIIAGLHQIFEETTEPNRARGATGPHDLTPPVGQFIVSSCRIREIHPEWWGATTTPYGGDTDQTARTRIALQSALDAAYNHRITRLRSPDGSFPGGAPIIDRRLPSIPVVLKGCYELDGSLSIGVTDLELATALSDKNGPLVPLGGFELRGDSAVGQATLRAFYPIVRHPPGWTAPISESDSGTLLTIRGPVSFSVRDVTFDGNYQIASCVAVEPVRGEWGHSSFEGCAFLHCRHTLVRLDAETRRRETSGQPKRDFWNITFSRCYFLVVHHIVTTTTVDADHSRDPAALNGVTISWLSFREGEIVAVDLRLNENEGAEFRNCFFTETASPAILARSGRFSLNETMFHTMRPAFRLGTQDDTRGRNDSRHGADISIESTPADGTLTSPGRLVPATFTARECESHSVQFLRTGDVPDGFHHIGQTRSAVVLMNVQSSHERADERHWQTGAAADGGVNWFSNHGAEPPAIYWSYPGKMGCALVMVGCSLGGPRAAASVPPTPAVAEGDTDWPDKNRHVVYTGPSIAGEIYDLGSNMASGGAGTTRWNDVIFNDSTTRMPAGQSSLVLAVRPNATLIRRFRPLRFDQFRGLR